MIAERTRRHESVLSTIGNTPSVRIRRLAPDGVQIYAKLEAANPLGSIKDRLALGVIEDAERTGALRPGQTVVEASSGNTGIGLAMVCAAKGYPLVVVMAENFSVERRRILRFLGARVVLTPASARGTGMIEKARRLAATHGWFLCRQFENEANADIHSRTTAREIVADFADERLDWWVTGFGTGGTLKGVARVLRQERPDTRIAVCEPDVAPLIGSGVRQARDGDGAARGSHPAFRTHPVQGWSPDFVAKLTEDAVDAGLIDDVVAVDPAEGIRLARELARREGIFTGISGGATFAAALDVARRAERGSTVLCMLPDTGERYLSTPLFDGIPVGMTDEEQVIAESTPAVGVGQPASVDIDAVDAESERFVDGVVRDARRPVVMFALRWCEFCWAVRRLFEAAGVPLHTVVLDDPGFVSEREVRAALRSRTGSPTVPQVFVGGSLIGGCSEVFDAWRSGRLQRRLAELGCAASDAVGQDPSRFLPSWVTAR